MPSVDKLPPFLSHRGSNSECEKLPPQKSRDNQQPCNSPCDHRELFKATERRIAKKAASIDPTRADANTPSGKSNMFGLKTV
jgi:hypothetical protein